MRLSIRIDRIAPEGKGLGKAPGSDKLVFVDHALPGELVEAEAASEKPRFVSARLRRVLESSSARVDPPCPYHFRPGRGDYCGGCDWQHADYQTQLKLKREIVVDCLRRIGKLEAPVAEALASPSPWRYRNKVQVPFQGSATGLKAGFYVPGSHRIVEFDDCLVQSEAGVAIIRTIKEMARRRGWPAYDEERRTGWLRHLFLRTTSEAKALVAFVTLTPEFPRQRDAVAELLLLHPQVVSVWQNIQPEQTSVILGPRWKKLHGEDKLVERVGPLELEFSPEAFLQVNTPAAEILYDMTKGMLRAGGLWPKLLLDLYSGVGAIALWLAREAGRVIGIEENRQAVQDASGNARRAGALNVSFVCGRAEQALGRVKGMGASPRAAVLDPPRSGCEEGVLRFLGKARMDRIVYLSCNPATFARDAASLVHRGYKLVEVQPVDLFPQTSHVELVARFDLVPGTR